MATDIQNVMSKIEKLLRLAESSNPAESAAAAAKARALLVEHNLSMSDVQGRNTEVNAMAQNQLGALHKNGLQSWEIALAGTLSRNFFCKVLLGKNSFYFVGSEHDLEVVTYLFSQLRTRINDGSLESMRAHVAEYKAHNGISAWSVTGANHPAAYQLSWQQGAVSGISSKLEEAKRQDTAQVTAMVVRKDNEIAKYIAQNIGRTGTRSYNTGTKNTGARERGYAAGRSMDIHAGIGTASPARIAG